ncbi:MAG: class I fructose-bisphosphate aldolase [Candidatus Magasanikbacteria bacterium]
MESLKNIAKKLVADGKGILAADESFSTIEKRFQKIGIESTEENRRNYREMLFSTPQIEEYVSGVILFDETVHQHTKAGLSFLGLLNEKGIIAGVKVDEGLEPLRESPEEQVTKGLEHLDEKLKKYAEMGIQFAKWRAVFTISENFPSDADMRVDAERLAEYAKMCQENHIVPIVEPEVLMDGSHTQERCYEVTELVLTHVFDELIKRFVDLEGMLLKPNMVIAGSENPQKDIPEEVAEKTVDCLIKQVPAEIPGIVFLSGGQGEEESALNLNAINKTGKPHAWKLTFSFGRALQNSALETWAGKDENVEKAQKIFYAVAERASHASLGKL